MKRKVIRLKCWLDAAWVNDHGPKEVLKRIKERVGDNKAYVSFDIDSLDPAYAPGTGTPVVAGMSIDCALKVVRGLVGLNLIGNWYGFGGSSPRL